MSARVRVRLCGGRPGLRSARLRPLGNSSVALPFSNVNGAGAKFVTIMRTAKNSLSHLAWPGMIIQIRVGWFATVTSRAETAKPAPVVVKDPQGKQPPPPPDEVGLR